MSFTTSDRLKYLGSKQTKGQFSTQQDRDTALSYQEQAKEAKKQEEIQKKTILDKLRDEYSRLISGSEVNYKQLSFARTFLHYKFGGGRPMYIDITGLDLMMISADDFNCEVGRVEPINTFNRNPFSTAGITIGDLRFEYLGNNKVRAATSDKYNFDINWGDGRTMRNIGTYLDSILHSSILLFPIPFDIETIKQGGTPYTIHFKGTANISPSKKQKK